MHGGDSNAGLFGQDTVRASHRMMLLTHPSERNMYLAEDRILCFEIVTKKREGWV